jgi:hypothetical protein
MEELLHKAVNALEDYLNAGDKDSRRKASIKAKEVCNEYKKISGNIDFKVESFSVRHFLLKEQVIKKGFLGLYNYFDTKYKSGLLLKIELVRIDSGCFSLNIGDKIFYEIGFDFQIVGVSQDKKRLFIEVINTDVMNKECYFETTASLSNSNPNA